MLCLPVISTIGNFTLLDNKSLLHIHGRFCYIIHLKVLYYSLLWISLLLLIAIESITILVDEFRGKKKKRMTIKHYSAA